VRERYKRVYLTQEEDYNCRFGGCISEDDFTTNYNRMRNSTSIADRIMADINFNQRLQAVTKIKKERRNKSDK
jgi:hypothetical protein